MKFNAREREIAATEAEIDNLVYELYGITDEERKISNRKATADLTSCGFPRSLPLERILRWA